MVLHKFPQTPPNKNFWTTCVCNTLPLGNQQHPPTPGRKLQHYYLQLLNNGIALLSPQPPPTPNKTPLLRTRKKVLLIFSSIIHIAPMLQLTLPAELMQHRNT